MTSRPQPFAQGASFLIVEDDMVLVTMIEIVLKDGGAERIAVCNSVADAMALIASSPFDVAIFDRQVHGGVSYPVAMLAQERGAVVIIASGLQTLHLPDRLSQAIVLRKPFTLPEFEQAVRVALSRR